MLRLAIPLATILFCWVTTRAEVAPIDGPPINLYGFPLPWHRWSMVSSMEYLVDVPALAMDFIVYVLVCSAALRASFLEGLRKRIGPTALLLAWAGALVSAGWLCLSLMGSISFGDVAPWPHRMTAYAIHFGTGYPY